MKRGVMLFLLLLAGCLNQIAVPMEPFSFNSDCGINEDQINKTKIQITKDSELIKMLNEYERELNCTIKKPSIDFEHKDLLGKYASGSGCTVHFTKRAYKMDTKKEYHYTVKVDSVGICDNNKESMNWVLVPKIPEDYVFK